AMLAVPMDLAGVGLSGAAPVPLADYVRVGGEGAQYAMSDTGELAYLPGDTRRFKRRVVWVDRRGSIEPLSLPARNYKNLALSPDGQRLAVQIDEGNASIWIGDLLRGTLSPLTTGKDRKSTRLNSSHVAISYAVFCLKKKN